MAVLDIQNLENWTNPDKYKQNMLDQYTGIASQYNQPVTYADSPVFQAGFEKWNPYGIGSVLARPVQKAKSALGLETAAVAAPFGSGMYVPPIEDTIKTYSKYLSNPKTAKALGEADWASQFGHETSHLGWEYENLGKQLESISPHLKTSASNPNYAGEEQWNYMHDLMYGPRYDEEVQGRPGESYLTTKGLINPGDLSYTPEAYNVIGESGLIPEHKKAIGFGVNPHEDTRAAGRWHKMQRDKRATEQGIAQVAMQRRIREAEAAKQKAAADAKAKADAAAAAPTSHFEARSTGGDYHSGHQSTVGGQTTDWGPNSAMIARGGLAQHAPRYANGGLIDFYRYGGFI